MRDATENICFLGLGGGVFGGFLVADALFLLLLLMWAVA